MTKGPKGFSEAEKVDLRGKLQFECEQSWALYGYKKTSISKLTASIGISTGAFYLLYPSKESLFCETLASVQKSLTETIRQNILDIGGMEGFRQALISHFDEYDKRPFLYDVTSVDFLAFINKLPQEKIEQLKFDSVASFEELVKLTGLPLAVSQEKAFAVTSSLLYTVTNKERVAYDHREVFMFLLDGILPQLFK
ncbi:TetR/AcrR family transcriptional regulator [Vagococcus sp. BWB3-3]|uniref:TetR/AcrR family transcriptional regulator n=1 Tax=Vagococcus allomyrinae TaxID=2794353 RepID=A0A940PA34_9ENTE|nr:TetR/AcrR family transcriptional regulator [Vagococcus allomyrinae]MBP1040757.1 TetR/AcrR family transcriptional regulator [Vagococcus allomyrinae]